MLMISNRFFHYSLDQGYLGILQRISSNPNDFSSQITIIDTSPLFDLQIQRTDRSSLALLLEAVKQANPRSVGLDVRLPIDSVYTDARGDSLLREVLKGWKQIVVPKGINPALGIESKNQHVSIRIHNGYEIPIEFEGACSLPFQMMKLEDSDVRFNIKSIVPIYNAGYEDLIFSGQIVSALKILDLWVDQTLTEPERNDELGLLLSGQWVLIGFCNEIMNVDRHKTPLGDQPGILIWANVLDNVLASTNIILYNPFRIQLLIALILGCMIVFLKRCYEALPFFYPFIFWMMAIGQLLVWTGLSWVLFTTFHIFIPFFSTWLAGVFAFPLYFQLFRLSPLLKLILLRQQILNLPVPLRHGFTLWIKESNPFKKMYMSFSLLEESLRFSVLFGLAQAWTLNIQPGDEIKKMMEAHHLKRPSFGQWHGLLRILSSKLSEESGILADWKKIYLIQDDEEQWSYNALFKKMDHNVDLHDRAIPRKKRVIKEKKSDSYLEQVLNCLYFQLYKVQFFVREKRKKFWENRPSLVYPTTLQAQFGQIKNMIQLRNKMIHDGGVYLDYEECTKVQPLFQNMVHEFMLDKLQFWNEIVCDETSNTFNYTEVSKVIRIGIEPFFCVEICEKHGCKELFVLNSVDLSRGKFSYQGFDSQCILEKKNKMKSSQIHRWLGFENKDK